MAKKRHQCLTDMDEFLKQHNTRLVGDLLNENRVFIATERIQSLRDGKRAKALIATYCPVCGKKLPD